MFSRLPRIISFSGRKLSGKTTIVNLCKDLSLRKYKEINFADGLKNLVADSLNMDLESLNALKEIRGNYDISKSTKFISEKINVDEKVVETYTKREFGSIREILQVIGSDLIRSHNPKWHINNLKNTLLNNADQYYCIGDCRFKDELELVKELGGEPWFIIRPDNIHSVSNHKSEIDLRWTDFGNNIIINDNIGNFKTKWTNYFNARMDLNMGYLANREYKLKNLKNKFVDDNCDVNYCYNYYNICPFVSAKSSLLFYKTTFDSIEKYLIKNVESRNDGFYFFENKIKNPLLCENLKLTFSQVSNSA